MDWASFAAGIAIGSSVGALIMAFVKGAAALNRHEEDPNESGVHPL